MARKASEGVFIVKNNLIGKEALKLAAELNNTSIHHIEGMTLSFSNEVKNIDATGLAILVRLYSQLSAKGKSLMLTDVPNSIQSTLDRHGLHSVFHCTETSGMTYAKSHALAN
jgi:anti-anti-sigma factor